MTEEWCRIIKARGESVLFTNTHNAIIDQYELAATTIDGKHWVKRMVTVSAAPIPFGMFNRLADLETAEMILDRRDEDEQE